ncbi:2-heptaprenyl- -naphthoquinone [Fusarium flagelliforme]|uniref:2-heptaprenyl--naphthoquinone n=1 Tax=Fusarium flagelliforme TaxID=2675880 RepID=A0A395MQE9_9HYPO|nr:2-heptaprenyl- -naphthoquinone [Fusarium flagelliforme]
MTDIVSENQAYFGKIANEYDQRNADAIVHLERLIQERIPLIGFKQGGRLLDYACGTGMLSRVLAQHINEAIGIDLSEDMVGVYNAQAQDQGSSRQAYQGNLADPTDASPAPFADAKFFDFDVAGVGLGFHHFDKPDLASKRLAERLKPGGVLFIIDFVAHKIDPKDAAKRGIAHHGFSEGQIKDMFEDAGLTDFVYQELPEPITFNDPMGHRHGHGHGHGHSHGSGTGHNGDHMGDKHEHAEGHGHGHGQNKSHSMTKQVFIARASKLR